MSSLNDDISSSVLRQMKAGGFDFTASTPSSSMPCSPTKPARRAAGSFVGNRSMPR
jgi:hypothetical protein